MMLLLLLAKSALGQQQVMFTQYMFNQLALNPAYAGTHHGLSASVLVRHQWVGFDGAPRTETFSIHSPIRRKKIAAGAVVIRDRIGITEQLGAHLSYAYRIKFYNQSSLSLGLQGSINQYQADFSSNPNNDPNLVGQSINDLAPNFGAGVLWHSERFYIGMSAPQLLNHRLGMNLGLNEDQNESVDKDPDSKLVRHYFLSAGYVFRLNHALKLKPNALFKWVEGAPFQLDLNANLLIMDVVWIGMSYRSFESVDALLQIQLSSRVQLGYAYDFHTTQELSRVNSGSHEIMLNFYFGTPENHIVSPRYF